MTLFDDDDPRSTAPSGPSIRVRMTLAYVGTTFRGFAAQPGVRTVAGDLVAAIARVTGAGVEVTCAGRTDAGVHAWGQVVHADLPGAEHDLDSLQRSLNGILKPAIVVRELSVAPEGFDARRSAIARRYRYTVLNDAVPDPFLAATAWHVAEPLDVRAMQAACDPLLGEHDFSSFCRRPPDGGSLLRRVHDARWERLDDRLLRFQVEAASFCHQMVRSIVGTLVEVGRGRRRAGDVMAILRARDRAAAAPVAPPHGLCLWEVVYP